MSRLIVESLLALRLEVDRLSFTPCMPPDWQSFTLSYRYRETTYAITVRGAGAGNGVRIVVDGVEQDEGSIRLVAPGRGRERPGRREQRHHRGASTREQPAALIAWSAAVESCRRSKWGWWLLQTARVSIQDLE